MLSTVSAIIAIGISSKALITAVCDDTIRTVRKVRRLIFGSQFCLLNHYQFLQKKKNMFIPSKSQQKNSRAKCSAKRCCQSP